MRHPDYLGLDQPQMAGWLAFYSAFPWGEEVEDLRHGINTAALVNIHLKKAQSISPQKFMVHRPEKRQQTAEEQSREASRIAIMTGGQVLIKSV